jgi:hypothetical protein
MENILVCRDGLIKDAHRDYILTNNTIVVLEGGYHILTYSDLSSATCNVYQIQDKIQDFIGNKFIYIDGEVILNPDYEE